METPASTPSTSDPVAGLTVAPPAKAATSTSSLLGGVIAIVVIGLGAVGMLLWRKRVAAKG
jgi:uncharacterized protein HemX